MATAKTAPTRKPPQKSGGARPPAPVLKVTRYDLVTSFMIAVVLGLIIAVVWLAVVWVTNRLPTAEGPAELELVELAGGEEEGAPDESLQVESPEEPVPDPQVDEVLENVVELSDQLAQMNIPREEVTGSKKGSASGTGRAPLGSSGGPGSLGREQRWFIRFSQSGTLDTYARQLDYFGIELGALLPGKMVYISNLSSPKPKVRTATSGSGETRMYMTWRGGNRRQGDIKLFKKAGINVGSGLIFHFYPKQTEQLLARTEREYANRAADEIRRTYFVVRSEGSGYRFVVTRQSYFR